MALAGQAIFRLELGKDDKVVNEEALLRDLNERIRDVRVFQDGAVYVLTDGADWQAAEAHARSEDQCATAVSAVLFQDF